MAEPTREDREAFAREYWPGGAARGTSGDVWIETGRGGNPAWDAGARAVAWCEIRIASNTVHARMKRAELLRLAAAVAVMVGEHEYARGRSEHADVVREYGELCFWLNRLHVGRWTKTNGKPRRISALERVKALLADHGLQDVIDEAEAACDE